MYILANMWFQNIMRTFFFSVDKIVFGFISTIYDLLITIARTSVLSQADILDMADRVYKLLAVFMVFKVTFSLIMYVVNPDDFSDKSKGVSKLGMNIVFSLAMLILTPYIFNYAYQLQTIILEDNSLAALVFGDDMSNAEDNPMNSAGDTMAFITLSPFFTPNISQTNAECGRLVNTDGTINEKCTGIEFDGSAFGNTIDGSNLNTLTIENGNFSQSMLKNYIAGVSHGSLGMMFRLDMAVATNIGNTEFVMEYRYIFSTVVGAIVVLLLLTFCMDVALRSIKLAFLQLIAPIPILSYVDPKSGKDGMFKKWYQMCFKTYLSLFLRLLALYFAVYIISRVDRMVDIVDGSYQTNMLVKIFIIIGALMFAKSFTKILEGLGLKLDGGFTLNPLKKFEDQALGGKNVTGMARGAISGTAGALTGAGVMRGVTGAWSGLKSGKGWSETGKATAEMNRKMRQAKLDGSTFTGRMGAAMSNALGLPTASENIEGQIHKIDEKIKFFDNKMAPSKKLAEEKKLYADAVAAMEKRAIDKIQAGEAGSLSTEYNRQLASIESTKAMLDQIARTKRTSNNRAKLDAQQADLESKLAAQEIAVKKYLNETAMQHYIDVNRNGTKDQRLAVFGKEEGKSPAYRCKRGIYRRQYNSDACLFTEYFSYPCKCEYEKYRAYHMRNIIYSVELYFKRAYRRCHKKKHG